MPRETLHASDETKQYFSELPIPIGINGNEVNGKLYWELFLDSSKSFEDLAVITETFRRMQDFYETINTGRFFLANAQRDSYPEIYSGETPAWANNWVKSQYVNSAIHAYSAAFDIYLQIIWVCYELYKQFPKLPTVLTDSDLDSILEACNINRVESQHTVIGTELGDKIKAFHLLSNTMDVRNLCKQIKHRQSISYTELSESKHPIMIQSSSYNSHKTLSEYSIVDVIGKLKQFHKDLVELSNFTVPIVTTKLKPLNRHSQY